MAADRCPTSVRSAPAASAAAAAACDGIDGALGEAINVHVVARLRQPSDDNSHRIDVPTIVSADCARNLIVRRNTAAVAATSIAPPSSNYQFHDVFDGDVTQVGEQLVRTHNSARLFTAHSICGICRWRFSIVSQRRSSPAASPVTTAQFSPMARRLRAKHSLCKATAKARQISVLCSARLCGFLTSSSDKKRR